jgi:hypothetical protein
VSPTDDWTDGRLDDLARRVDALTGLPVQIERLSGSVKGLSGSVNRLATKVDELEGDPVAEKRAARQGIRIAIVAAVATGLFTTVGGLLLLVVK